MTLATGDRIPSASFIEIGPEGPRTVDTAALFAGRRVVVFAVPGAFTPTCHSAHMPSFVRTAGAFAAKGVDEIVCIAVNDPFVLEAWAAATGARAAGIRVLSDAAGAFTRAAGMDFTAEPVGLIGRSMRYAMLVEDGAVAILNVETARGTCEISGGEALLAAL